jgi:hypothetical protein
MKIVERGKRNKGVGEDGKSGFGKYTMLDDAPGLEAGRPLSSLFVGIRARPLCHKAVISPNLQQLRSTLASRKATSREPLLSENFELT